jgi:hypothetical protein
VSGAMPEVGHVTMRWRQGTVTGGV